MTFIEQCKGIDANKINIKDEDIFLVSQKYDGIYIQIQKKDNEISFFTSSGKDFKCSVGNDFLALNLDYDFIIEAEYILKDGLLGTRAYADNEIKKVIKDNNFKLNGTFMIHDIININKNFIDREKHFNVFQSYTNSFIPVKNVLMNFSDAKKLLDIFRSENKEGLILKKENYIYKTGKRTNDIIKLKPKYTADLKVISIKDDYYTLEDDCGRIINNLRISGIAEYAKIGTIIEIEYEQLLNTYQIPVFKCIRFDKMV